MAKSPRNNFEKKIAGQLKKSKYPYKYESMRIPYTLQGYYLPDFICEKNGIILETKGHFRPEAKRKMAAIKKENPQLDIRIIFYSKKDKDIRWAEKLGFKWAVGDVPEDWLKE